MTIAHMGLGVAVLGLTTVQSFTVERDVALAPGQLASVGGYEFRFEGVKTVEGPNYDAIARHVRGHPSRWPAGRRS